MHPLHWIPEQAEALRGIRLAMMTSGSAQLRLVPLGKRMSLERVIDETCLSPRWMQYFPNFRSPYLHLTPEQYGALAEQNGLHVRQVQTHDKTWDFKTRSAFAAFGSVTFVAWTQFLPEGERLVFVNDALDRYRAVAFAQPGEENVFKFYQIDFLLTPD
jgi:trans-aconitate 2-methyltransferase